VSFHQTIPTSCFGNCYALGSRNKWKWQFPKEKVLILNVRH